MEESSTKSVVAHTPGPWHTGGTGGLIVFDASGYATANATVFHGRNEDGESAANARLIAAAPELLEALELAVATIERLGVQRGPFKSGQGTLDVALAAIAKARGQ